MHPGRFYRGVPDDSAEQRVGKDRSTKKDSRVHAMLSISFGYYCLRHYLLLLLEQFIVTPKMVADAV